MKIHFHGAAGMVTGSCYRVECGNTQFLVDCGMFQGNKSLKQLNYGEFSFIPKKIDFVLVTHAHIDHTGLLPKLVKKGFSGKIYASRPTADLLTFMLPDSARIQETEVEQKNRRGERKGQPALEPIYTSEDAEKTLSLIQGIDQNENIELNDSVQVKFRNAGHVLGSSFLEVVLTEGGATKRIIFSGDLGSKDHPILKDPDLPGETDVLLVESTYGDRVRPEEKKEDRLQRLAAVIRESKKRGGNLIIPAFAVERTQDIMHDIMIVVDRKLIPETQVVVDSPLAINATKVFAKYPDLYDEDATGLMKNKGSIFDHPNFKFTITAAESMALNDKRGIIIMSASGMCDAGRIKHHLKHNLWRRDSTILFVGYQAEGTLGRLLLDGEKIVRIQGQEIRVEARIEEMMGYSGHADQNGLMEWVGSLKDVHDKVFVVHGEEDSRNALAKLIKERKNFSVQIPAMGETYDLLQIVTRESPVPAIAVSRDSFNLYADLSIKLAEFMRREKDEEKRRTFLERILKSV